MRSIVFSTVSHLDMYTGEDRKDRWRPLLELLRIHDFKVDRLYFFISHLYRHIVPTLVKDMNNVCPETEIVPVITNLNGVLTYEDIAPAYKVFSAYFEQYRFDLSNERYFFHLGPGNLFQHALMLIMLFHFKRLPFQMLRLAPNPEKPGDIIMEIYEGDIRKWIASIADSEKRNVAAQTFLKSCIETRNPVFNKLIEEMEHVATHSTAPVLLSGPTGSGKSTLVNLVPRFYDVSEGTLLIDGIDVTQLDPDKLRAQIAVVPQKALLFSGTIAENLRWGKENASLEELQRAAEMACADSFVRSFPDGYETSLGQGGVNLSGGQKQRLTIARALVRKPEILILDDSASALDYATDASLRKAIRDMKDSPTVFIVSQRASSIKYADKIVVLDDGKIAGIGNHDVLLETCSVYQEIYYSQFSKDRKEA